MNVSNNIESVLFWTVRVGLWLLLFVPLIITGNLFFPYITGKNFFFRVVVEIITGAWIGLLILGPAYRPKKGPLLWAIILFVSVLTIATVFGVDPYHSFWSNFERMEGLVTHLHLLALFLVASSVLKKEQDWRLLFQISVGVSVLVAVVGLLERTGVLMLGGSVGGSGGAGRIFSTLGNPIYLANYLLFHFFLIGYLFWRAWGGIVEGRRYLWLCAAYALIFFLEVYVFFAAGTRGASLGLLAGVGTFLILLVAFSRNRMFRAVAGISFLILASLVGVFLAAKNTSFIQSRPLLMRLSDIRLNSTTVQSRFMVWGMAWDGFRERPLLGWGPENFIVPFAKYYRPDFFGNEPWFDRVHNMHLEWLVAGGIVGFLAYLALFSAVFLTIGRLWRRGVFDTLVSAVFTGLFVAYLAHNFFVFDTIVSYILITFLFAFLHSISSQWGGVSKERNMPPRNTTSARGAVSTIVVFVGVGIALFLNLRPLGVAAHIIDTLEIAGRGRPLDEFLETYRKTLAEGTFGGTEARERLIEFALQGILGGQVSEQDALLLLGESIAAADDLTNQFFSVRYLLSNAKLRQLRFILFRDEGDRDASLRFYLEAREQAPRYPPTSLGLAELYLAIRQFDKAEEVVDEIFSQITRQNILFRSVILVHAHTGDFDGAIRWMEHFMLLGPKTYPPYVTPEDAEAFAKRSLLAGDAEGRERFLQVLMEDIYNFDNAVLFLAFSQTEAELGKKEEARIYALKAVGVQPDLEEEVQEFLKTL